MIDETENIRRDMVNNINSGPSEREVLEKEYGKVYNTEEVSEAFKITGFMAPFITVVRRSDNIKGTMMFQDRPRYYFSFKEV